jgi:hypothetical protein
MTDRLLVLLRVDDAEPERLARALGLAPADAVHRVRRGGWQLLRIAAPAVAEPEAARLAGEGLAAVLVPEAEVRVAARPRLAVGGEWTGRSLALRTSEGALSVERPDLLLVVQGPIAREYQTSPQVKRTRTATLEGGYRFHLHRHAEPRPVELDPWSFGFGPAGAGSSSLLQLAGWVQELAAGLVVDDGFRRLPAELGVAEAGAGGPVAAADALAVGSGGRERGSLLLDNLRQFRFYSAWRGAVERRGAGHPPS